MLVSFSAIVVLLILSAFFSGAETALTAASRPLMHQLQQRGNPKAGIVNRLRDNSERLIGAILLGNNLVNISASALATGTLVALYGEAGVACLRFRCRLPRRRCTLKLSTSTIEGGTST